MSIWRNFAVPDAIRQAYPRARLAKLPSAAPDSVIGAWERLADVLGRRPLECDGFDKYEWASNIATHLDVDNPKSPSLRAFVAGIAKLLETTPTRDP